MAYATKQDIVDLYSEDALFVADRDGDGVVDDVAVDKALKLASGEIDGHIAVRYPLPLDAIPDNLMRYCIDIAVYRLAQTRDVLTEEHRTRYEDVKADLKLISDGKMRLVFPVDPNAPVDPEDVIGNSAQPIVSTGPERLFTREKMRDL